MLPSTVLQNTYQNDMYTVSFNEAVSLFYYNKDVFEEHGFRIPEGIDDAYTLDEVYEMAKEVSTPEKYSLQGTTQSRYLTGGVPPVRFSM